MTQCHADIVEIARGDFAPHLLDNTVPLNLTVLGDALWAVAYILIIVQSFRQRTYGLPLVAIAMNFTWELQYTLVQPPRCNNGSIDVVKLVMIGAWVLLDLVIVFQLFRYGRAEQRIPAVRDHFPVVVIVTLIVAAIGHLTFARFHPTDSAPLSGMIINFVMSVLFIFLLFDRPDLRGISWSGALFRVAGNGVIFFANIFLMRENKPGLREFALFLFGATAFFDVVYLTLLYNRRRGFPPGIPPVAPA